MADRIWTDMDRGFLKRRPAGIVSKWRISTLGDPSKAESAIIMAVFNALISCKMSFEEVPKTSAPFGIKAKHPLIQYAIDGGRTYLLVHADIEKDALVGFSCIIVPVDPSVKESVDKTKDVVSSIPDPLPPQAPATT